MPPDFIAGETSGDVMIGEGGQVWTGTAAARLLDGLIRVARTATTERSNARSDVLESD